MNPPFEKLPPWKQPIQYNDPGEESTGPPSEYIPPQINGPDPFPLQRKGPHNDPLELDDDDELDDLEEYAPTDDTEVFKGGVEGDDEDDE